MDKKSLTLAEIRVLRSEDTIVDEVIAMLPPEFIDFYKNLCKLDFEDKPDYDAFQLCLRNVWERERSKVANTLML